MSVYSLTDYDNGVRSAPTPAPTSPSPAKTDESTTVRAASTGIKDTVDISPEGLAAAQASALLSGASSSRSYSVGSGYDSGDKTFDQVKQDMRALFDTRINETGLEISSRTTGKETIEFLGDIKDRRALFAVYGDKSGTFTKAERNVSYHLMWQQKNDVEYGPSRTGTARGPFRGGIDFLNRAGPEEKATFEWVKQRAVAQIGYENSRRFDNYGPNPFGPYGRVSTGDEKVDSLILRLLAEGLENYDRPLDKAVALEDSQAYARAQGDFSEFLASGHIFTFTPPPVEA